MSVAACAAWRRGLRCVSAFHAVTAWPWQAGAASSALAGSGLRGACEQALRRSRPPRSRGVGHGQGAGGGSTGDADDELRPGRVGPVEPASRPRASAVCATRLQPGLASLRLQPGLAGPCGPAGRRSRKTNMEPAECRALKRALGTREGAVAQTQAWVLCAERGCCALTFPSGGTSLCG